MAVCLLITINAFGQTGVYMMPDVRAKPDFKDTLVYSVIVYSTPENILKEVVMENDFLKKYVEGKTSVEVLYKKKYSGPAHVNEKYKEYIEVLELTIISY